jgi:hypothetical protein
MCNVGLQHITSVDRHVKVYIVVHFATATRAAMLFRKMLLLVGFMPNTSALTSRPTQRSTHKDILPPNSPTNDIKRRFSAKDTLGFFLAAACLHATDEQTENKTLKLMEEH